MDPDFLGRKRMQRTQRCLPLASNAGRELGELLNSSYPRATGIHLPSAAIRNRAIAADNCATRSSNEQPGTHDLLAVLTSHAHLR